jgi:ACS family 4-hydroxyphenylacetate permease-like MFS transporter
MDFALPDAAVRKAFRHVLPWCVAFYMAAYLDRINVGFAALTMNKDLGLTATTFGLANTFFYAVYVGFEAPSTLMLARFGARFWLSRIMITWGLASMATVFATGPHSFYALRMLVGAAEAGLTPGVLFYIGLWFPSTQRAQANSVFLASLAMALVVGAPLSGLILQMNGWLGLVGWRWVFLLEGVPPIILGVVALFTLPNGPQEVPWLSADEKAALDVRLKAESRASSGKGSLWRTLASPRILCLSAIYFCIQASLNTLGLWTPQIVKDLVGPANSVLMVSLISAIPPALAVVSMVLAARDADRRGIRAPHVVAGMVVGGLGWIMVALGPTPTIKLIGLILAFCGNYAAICMFWAATTGLVGSFGRAAAIGVISTLGTTAAIVSPFLIGSLRDLTHSFAASAWYVAILLMSGGAAMVIFARQARREAC